MNERRFPWANAMAIGMGMLRLPPETFWRMTLPELSAAACAIGREHRSKIDRHQFEDLMTRFPDNE